MLIDVFIGTNILSAWISVYLALPILASSAFNPWIYGYRNSELRTGVRRVVDDLLTTFGFTYRSQQVIFSLIFFHMYHLEKHFSVVEFLGSESEKYSPKFFTEMK